jgi:hypothetical protein
VVRLKFVVRVSGGGGGGGGSRAGVGGGSRAGVGGVHGAGSVSDGGQPCTGYPTNANWRRWVVAVLG